ncbi:MATH domain and coiled-coil domain-containing protein At3g58360-like [Lotus japonicus]|uniref:MATH domain and coiled-coil domain-containing protein At3g58360-like n=1 Tax=Lotus japonicus TaxID=34305 RepID=UPI00258BE5F0|nr:MATH domain and coiled-coil domain-containing protein At3g58360-like [Lotus japonicus]
MVTEKFTWKIENFSKLDSEECSDIFHIGGHSWALFIYPTGNDTDYLSFSLFFVERDLPDDWCIFANFNLALINQVNGKRTITKGFAHTFNARDYEWHWPDFIPLVELRNSTSGFIVNDTCILEAEMAVVKPEHVTQADQVVCKPTLPKQLSMSSDGELADFLSFGKIEKTFIPLLKQVCLLHPSLIDCQQKRSRRFKEWAFTALGQVLHFLKSRKVKDMDADACGHLQLLWEELQTFNFDLTWLQPHIQSALSMKGYIEKAVHLKTMKENLATLEMETKSLKEKIFTAEVDLTVARRDLAKGGLEEKDLDAELAYGGP